MKLKNHEIKKGDVVWAFYSPSTYFHAGKTQAPPVTKLVVVSTPKHSSPRVRPDGGGKARSLVGLTCFTTEEDAKAAAEWSARDAWLTMLKRRRDAARHAIEEAQRAIYVHQREVDELNAQIAAESQS